MGRRAVTRCVVLGTGRSGTAYVAAMLNALGYRFGHESVYDWQDDSGSAQRWAGYDGDVSLAAWYWIGQQTEPVRVAVVERDLDLVARSFLGTYFFADECPCHPPGAHYGAPYFTWFRKVLPRLENCEGETNRCQVYLGDVAAAIAETTRLAHVDYRGTWSLKDLSGSSACAQRFVREFIGDEIDMEAAEAAIDRLGRINTHPPHPSRSARVVDHGQ